MKYLLYISLNYYIQSFKKMTRKPLKILSRISHLARCVSIYQKLNYPYLLY